MAVKDPKIRYINLSDGDHAIAAKALLDSQDSEHTWEDITALVTAGFTIETPWNSSDYASTAAPSAAKLATVPSVAIYYNNGQSHTTGTLSATNEETRKHIYLIYHPHNNRDSFDEYISNGVLWELIGNSDIDLSDYAKKTEAVAAGTYTTSTPSSNATGSAGAATITTSVDSGYVASGTATITYGKASTQTGSSGGTGAASNTGNAGSAIINGGNFTFTGDSATITMEEDTVELSDHRYTPAGTISKPNVNLTSSSKTVATGVSSVSSDGAHTHSVSVNTHDHGDDVTVVTGVTAASLGGTTTFNTDAIKSASLTGTTSFNTDAIKTAALETDTSTAPTFAFNTDAIKSASLTGTTSFNIDAIKDASLTGTTSFNTDAIKSASLTGTTSFNTDAIKAVSVVSSAATTDTDRMMTSATVSSAGVLSFNFGKLSTTSATKATVGISTTAASKGTVSITTTAATKSTVGISTTAATTKGVKVGTTAATKATVGISTTAASKGTVTISGGVASGTASVAGAKSATTITATAASAGAHTHTVTLTTATVNHVTGAALASAPVFTGTEATIAHSFVDSASSKEFTITYTPTGTIGGSQTIAAHSHTYTAPAAHTHSIAVTNTTVTGVAAVDIADHSHTVTIAAHTHTLGNHTHNVTLPAIRQA